MSIYVGNLSDDVKENDLTPREERGSSGGNWSGENRSARRY